MTGLLLQFNRLNKTKLYKKYLLLNSVIVVALTFILGACVEKSQSLNAKATVILKDSVLLLAQKNIHEKPVTITAFSCDRSAGTQNDFYSEGDYWWPDPENPGGPYIRKDGLSNPKNFTSHREAMLRFSQITGNLASAYLLTNDTQYANAIIKHLQAWFITDSTRMNPNLLYAQAIKGRYTGRGIGIIDAIHLMEVVEATMVLESHHAIDPVTLKKVKQWFSEFTQWLITHPYGHDEMVHPNNHGTCWNMQVGLYAKFTGNDTIYSFCRDRFINHLLPDQMAADGSFPLEQERTKPYGYSLFNLDAMVMNCLILSDSTHNLWQFSTPDGKSIKKGLEYMAPYIQNKNFWPLKPDVMYWEKWPVAQPAMLFGAKYYQNNLWFELWKEYRHFPETEEVLRNVPIRNPLIWLE